MSSTVASTAAAGFTPAATARRPLVLIHGYSSNGAAFDQWKPALARCGTVADIHVGQYVSLSNEVTVKDIAEGLDRALALAGIPREAEFDAIVHSTGMLVVRSWLTTYPERRGRLKHLIGLAPATYGSPLAHRGRSWLGAMFKGSKKLGPDFMEAGDQVLDALELGSRFTWDLAHRDLFGERPYYGADADTPYVFVFIGNKGYGGLARFVNDPGTDGTVRWASCSLNSRKITVDLTRGPRPGEPRVVLGEVKNVSRIPTVFVPGRDHGSIMDAPPPDLEALVRDALAVGDAASLDAWCARAEAYSAAARPKKQYQQFVVRLVDERGDPVTDYHTAVFARRAGEKVKELAGFSDDVHVYGRDHSLRNFHVDVGDYLETGTWEAFHLRLIASSGSRLVGYRGFNLLDGTDPDDGGVPVEEVWIDLMPMLRERQFHFFHPFTTTLIEIRINREPLPTEGRNEVYHFL